MSDVVEQARPYIQTDEFTRIFFQMEMEENLFALRAPNGNPFWDVVRFEIFYSLFEAVNERQEQKPPDATRPQRSLLKAAGTFLSKAFMLAAQWIRYRRMQPVDFVAYICSRYKQEGNPIDYASHEGVQILFDMGTVQKIESAVNVFEDVNINSIIHAAERFHRLSQFLKRYFGEVWATITAAQLKHFGKVDPRLQSIISETFTRHMVEHQLWSKILDRTRPSLVVMTQNGISKGLILAARQRGIPVLEFQHGAINLMHLAYAYPPGHLASDSVILPDTLSVFSEYWTKQCRMPGTNVVAIGNSYFSNNAGMSTRTGAAVFASAGIFHPYLSPLAIDVARAMPERKFIMKLHPAQLADRTAIENEYEGIENLHVVGMEQSMDALLADASDLIIIESTAAYEALDRGVPVHILKKKSYMAYQDLFVNPNVQLFSDAEELQNGLFESAAPNANESRFFEKFDDDKFKKILDDLSSFGAATAGRYSNSRSLESKS